MRDPAKNREYQRQQIENEKANGYVRVLVRIPIERKEELKEIVQQWQIEGAHHPNRNPR
jgi:hypothetical protein